MIGPRFHVMQLLVILIATINAVLAIAGQPVIPLLAYAAAVLPCLAVMVLDYRREVRRIRGR